MSRKERSLVWEVSILQLVCVHLFVYFPISEARLPEWLMSEVQNPTSADAGILYRLHVGIVRVIMECDGKGERACEPNGSHPAPVVVPFPFAVVWRDTSYRDLALCLV